MDDEYEVFDYMQSKLPNLQCSQKSEHIVYVSKSTFDQQLQKGQNTSKKLIHQLKIDFPRIHVFLDGKRVKSFHKISKKLTLYCTQAVMALPVEILSLHTLVAEQNKPKRMEIYIVGDSVCIKKSLRIFDTRGWLPIEINVYVDIHHECVTIKFITGQLEEEEL